MTEMSHEKGNTDFRNIDARDQRDGGWSWIQDEIYTVFLPLIGREATHLYQVMTYLIPLRQRNPIFDLTIRKIADVSGMSTTNVHRNLKVLHVVGLMPRVSSDPPMFFLADLRKLAKVSRVELARRIAPLKRASVPQGNNDEEGVGSDLVREDSPAEALTEAAGADTQPDGATPQKTGAALPEASDGGLVPLGNMVADLVQEAANQPEKLWKTDEAEQELVPQEGILVPEKGGFCSPGERPYIEVSRQSKYPTPYPRPGGGAVKNLAHEPDPEEPGPKSIPDEKLWAAFIVELRDAMHDVPIGLHSAKRWGAISREHHDDFRTCFSTWWLLEIERGPAGVVFKTFADDEAVTEAGIAKYSKRLTRALREIFRIAKDVPVSFQVLRAPDELRPPEEQKPIENLPNGEVPADDREAWEEVQRLAKEHLAKLSQTNPAVRAEWYEQAVEPAQLVDVEGLDGKRRWRIRSPEPWKTEAVLMLLEPVFPRVVRGVAIVVLPTEGESP